MKATIQIHDRKFAEIISYEKIVHRIKQISDEISLEYKNLTPVFLPVFKWLLYVCCRLDEGLSVSR
jgi:hypoxanthine-guanine phosphoribosyltransferase